MSAYIVEPRTIERVLKAVDELDRPEYQDNKVEKFQKLGEELYKLNTLAVNGRYGTFKEASVFKYVSPNKVLVTGDTLYQLYKNIQCLKYQCTEGDAVYDPLYMWLNELEREFGSCKIGRAHV